VSHFLDVQTTFRDQACLLEALSHTWSVDKIEVHEEPKHLTGYEGDTRPEKAHIIIRRQHIGCASNDIGFVKNEDGSYSAIISEYDRHKYNDQWLGTLKQQYAVAKIKKEYKKKGLVVREEQKPNGRVRLRVQGFR
jgi:hypothetical protein